MEIIYSKDINEKFSRNKVNLFYGDALDLIDMGINVIGIDYDDEYTVKRFLNGYHLKLNNRIESILKYVEFDKKYLKTKIKDLSKVNFKYTLLAYLLLKNVDVIIFDHFEIGLSFKEQKKLIKIIRNLIKDGKTIIVISKDLLFMSQLSNDIIVAKSNQLSYDGKISDLISGDGEFSESEEIIKFINLANKRGANLEYTLDSKELLKDIYRSVC